MITILHICRLGIPTAYQFVLYIEMQQFNVFALMFQFHVSCSISISAYDSIQFNQMFDIL